MKKYSFKTSGVCSQKIDIVLNRDNRIDEVIFTGGCQGNLSGISKLVTGMEAHNVIKLLKGNDCGGRGTSCPDQLARALKEMIA